MMPTMLGSTLWVLVLSALLHHGLLGNGSYLVLGALCVLSMATQSGLLGALFQRFDPPGDVEVWDQAVRDLSLEHWLEVVGGLVGAGDEDALARRFGLKMAPLMRGFELERRLDIVAPLLRPQLFIQLAGNPSMEEVERFERDLCLARRGMFLGLLVWIVVAPLAWVPTLLFSLKHRRTIAARAQLLSLGRPVGVKMIPGVRLVGPSRDS